MARVDAWMSQREQIANELRRVADMMIKGGDAPFPWRGTNSVSTRAGGPSTGTTPAAPGGEGTGRTRTARKRRTMSAEARAKIAAAQRARWARQKGQTPGAAKASSAAKGAKKAK